MKSILLLLLGNRQTVRILRNKQTLNPFVLSAIIPPVTTEIITPKSVAPTLHQVEVQVDGLLPQPLIEREVEGPPFLTEAKLAPVVAEVLAPVAAGKFRLLVVNALIPLLSICEVIVCGRKY